MSGRPVIGLLILAILLAGVQPLVSMTVGDDYIRAPSSVFKLRWGNVSMIEVTADLIFTVVNTTQYTFYIPNSWSVSPALTSTDNKLYKVYYIPINPINPKPNELVITFKYDIYVAPPPTSAPFNFKSRVIINSPEEKDMPEAMKEVARELFSNAETYYEVIYRATDFTSDYITYDLNYVTKNLSVSQIWNLKRGVCRHYAKFEKALLNYAGVQVLYTNGFLIYEENGEQMVIPHAWLLVYDPANGWFPVDPTNHNFNHDNDFSTGVVFPFDLLVYAGSEYKMNLDLPVNGAVTGNNLKMSFKVISIKPLKYLKIYEYRLKNTFSFICVENAGLLIYHPLKQTFTDNSPLEYFSLVSKYEKSIVEYVPAGYLVPIGFEPYDSPVFLNYYYDVKPLNVPINATITVKNGTIVFSGFPKPIYLTNSLDEHVPLLTEDGNQLWPVQKGFTMVADGKYYIPVFGVWYYLPMTINDLKSVSVEPVAVYSSDGVTNVVLHVKTEPNIGNNILNYVTSNFKVTRILGNGTFIVSGYGNELSLRISKWAFKFDLDRVRTLVKATGLTVNVTPSRTVFNVTFKNLDAYTGLNLTLPSSAVIDGEAVRVYDVRHGKDWVSFAVPTTPGLLTNDFSLVYLSPLNLNHSLLDPSFKISGYKLLFVNPGLVKLVVTINATTWANITSDAIRQLFSGNLLGVSGSGREHVLQVYENVPSNLLKLSFSTVITVMGENVEIPVIVDNFNTLKVSKLQIDSYSYTNTSVQITMTEVFSSLPGVADTPTLVLLKTKLRPFSYVNGVPVPYSDYYQRGASLVVTVNVPLGVLKKSDSIVIDGVRLGNSYTVRVVDDYTSPGLVVKGLAPLGGLECSVPYTIEQGDKDGTFKIALDIHEVGKTATCRFGGREYVVKPQYPGIVSMTLSDTDRINDVLSNGRGVYAGYDGVYLTVTTTQPPAFGEYKLVIDNRTLTEGKLTTLTVKLPQLGVGRHVVELYDGDFLVWKGYVTVYPQPITLKLLHHWAVILVVVILVIGALVTGVVSTEPYTVTVAKRMFPNYEFVQHTKRGNWEVVTMYDPMTGNYIFVYFFNGRFQSVSSARY